MLFLLVSALLPPASLAAYIFPEISLQAKSSGGLKVFLPDSCGVEGFGFQVKSKSEPSWRTGNGTKVGKFWTWEDKARALKVGDELEFSPRVWYRGTGYSLPISRWYVPELVDDYLIPPLSDQEQQCRESKDLGEPGTTPPSPTEPSREPALTQPAKQKESPRNRKNKHEPRPRPKTLPSPKEDQDDDSDEDDDDDDVPKLNLSPPSSTGPPFSISCNWLDPPGPGLSKEEALERQLALLQCEMSTFLERTTKLTSELNKELLDLKKLNYATVARMQRLESLIRTIPRAVPFSYI